MNSDNNTFSEQYENLPGFKVNYQDGNLTIGASSVGSNTKSLLIIGTAIDGIIGEPISVNALGGPTEAEKVFGKSTERLEFMQDGKKVTVNRPHQGTLIRAMWEAYYLGCEDIRLLRVKGRKAKSEINLRNQNAEKLHALMDSKGDSTMPGSDAFSIRLGLANTERLVSILNVQEFKKETDVLVKTYEGNKGYSSVDATVGAETVYFNKNLFQPTNKIKVNYDVKQRTYTDVAHTEDGVINAESTKGLLVQDSVNNHYFKAEKVNWSDDPLHTVIVYVTTAEGETSTIPAINASGEKLFRIGKEDPSVRNELTDTQTTIEYQQGGIRFTSAYDKEVAALTYPDITQPGVRVTVDYKFYADVTVTNTKEFVTTGSEKITDLQGTPINDSLRVYYEIAGQQTDLTPTTDYTLSISLDPNVPSKVIIHAGAGPKGARLFATYKTSTETLDGAVLVVEGLQAGTAYGGFADGEKVESLDGVKFAVEYAKDTEGKLDLENRVIRFIKPYSKRNSRRDLELRYETAKLEGIKTIREFVNFVNNDANNNIVHLSVDSEFSKIPVTGIQVTDFTVDDFNKEDYTYREINLGEKFNDVANHYTIYEELGENLSVEERYPWLGANGFFDNTDMVQNREYYDMLGGRFEVIREGEEPVLVEQGIFGLIENYPVDQISIVDVYANSAIAKLNPDGSYELDRDISFSQQLAQHCAMATAKTWETIGFIQMAPVYESTLRKVQEYIDVATGYDYELEENTAKVKEYQNRGINPFYVNDIYMYVPATGDLVYDTQKHLPIDIGFYVNVIFGPEVGFSTADLGNYISGGGVAYAGLVSTLEPQNSTTNHQFDVVGLRYTLSEAQHNQLAGKGYITFEARIDKTGAKTYKVKDGVTGSKKTSDYTRLTTVRISHYVVQLIRNTAEKFIGLPNGLGQRNSLATEIQAVLDAVRDAGILNDFQFEMYSSARDQVLGNIFIKLDLVPVFETRKIATTVALRPSL